MVGVLGSSPSVDTENPKQFLIKLFGIFYGCFKLSVHLLSVMLYGEFSDPSNEESMSDVVTAQVVDMGLSDVNEVAGVEGLSANMEVESQAIANVGSVEGVGKANVMVGLSEREELIVGLPIVGAEHGSKERQVDLVAKREAASPKPEGECRLR